ncbi:hypothetical protein U1Q18_017836 [Sarracenia purpurea var. burkii]
MRRRRGKCRRRPSPVPLLASLPAKEEEEREGDDREDRNQFDERGRSAAEKKREGKRSDHHRWWRHLWRTAQPPATALEEKERSGKQGYWRHQTRRRRQCHSPRLWHDSVRFFVLEVGSETLSINFMFMS